MRIVTQLEGLERIYLDNEFCAELAGLNYISDTIPGITRVKNGESFEYVDGNKTVTNKKLFEYCNSLAIPPAWKEVWINKDRSGHLLVTGLDDKGRKQYIYHRKWREVRGLVNFYRVLLLAVSLPKIRGRVASHLSDSELKKRKTIALILYIMMKRPIRIGNELYAETNNTFGLSTFEKRHVRVTGSRVVFNFIGKSNKLHVRDIRDPLISSIIKDLIRLEGEKLFQYRNKEGALHAIKPDDVNEYLRRVSGYHISAKDFRTWIGTLEAFQVLKEQSIPETKKETKENIKEAVETAADTLGNTPAIARKSYVHPRLIQSFEDKTFFEIQPKTQTKARMIPLKLKQMEKELLSFLNYYLEEDVRKIKEEMSG